MPEATFERAFSDLAHANLRDKAPGLMDHLIGFQLIDKNDEDTHAVGVFGFKVGETWLYAPVFFLNGSLKGSDLLYVKGQDMFVPLQDNWVNYLISKQPYVLGTTEPKTESELKLQGPDFSIWSESPDIAGSKWASTIDARRIKAWARPFLPVYQELVQAGATKHAGLGSRFDLKNVVREHPETLEPLLGTIRQNTKFAEAVMAFYDVKDLMPPLDGLMKTAAEQVKTPVENVSISDNYVPRLVCTNCEHVIDVPPGSDIKKCPKCGATLPDHAAEVATVDKESATRMDPWTQSGKSADEIIASLEFYPKTRKRRRNGLRDLPTKTAADVSDIPGYMPAEPVIIDGYDEEDQPTTLGAPGGFSMTDEEKRRLRAGDIVVRDHRQNTSTVYNAEFDRKLTNPSETGVYDVLTATGEFAPCLVICNPKTVGKGRTAGVCTVVTEDNRYGNFRNLDLYVREAETGGRGFSNKIQDWYDRAKPLSSMQSGHLYVAFDEKGVGTLPFKFLRSFSSNDGTTDYRVKQKTEVRRSNLKIMATDNSWENVDRHIQVDETADYAIPENGPGIIDGDDERRRGYYDYELNDSRGLLETDREGVANYKVLGGTSIVPEGRFRVIDIGREWRADGAHGQENQNITAEGFDSGTLADAEQYILKLGAQLLEVHKDGPTYIVRGAAGQQSFNKKAALKHLLRDWHMGEADARSIVKEASRARTKYFVKAAQPPIPELQQTAPGAPAIPMQASTYNQTLNRPVLTDQTDFEVVPGTQPLAENKERYNLLRDPEIEQMYQAAANGQKEIFDTSVVSGLVKAVDVDSLTDSMIPDIIKGMDRVGRILFMFYWHNERFRDRYGRQDMIDLEDSLRNVFGSLGDLVLFLKQKTIEATPMQEAIDIDLEEAAG